MVDEAFERHFHRRADLADELVGRGLTVDGIGLAAGALDALGAIWFHDFPATVAELSRELGGNPPPSIRLARMMARFAPTEPSAQLVAVVSFAEDWKRYASETAGPAEKLLARRIGEHPNELPRSYLDKPLGELIDECPEIGASKPLRSLAAEYTYAAMLYRFYRCPILHLTAPAHRTHGFTVDDEVMYMRLRPGFTSISFGPALVTRWLGVAATGYTRGCAAASVHPPKDMDPAGDAEELLKSRWERVAKRA